MQFRVNEFGLMEVVDEDEHNKQDKENGAGDKENVFLSQKSSKSTSSAVVAEKKSKFLKIICLFSKFDKEPKVNQCILFRRGKEKTSCQCGYFLLLPKLWMLWFGSRI